VFEKSGFFIFGSFNGCLKKKLEKKTKRKYKKQNCIQLKSNKIK